MHQIAKEHGIDDLDKFVEEHKHELKWFQDHEAAKALQPQVDDESDVHPRTNAFAQPGESATGRCIV